MRQILTKTGIICVVVVHIITFFNILPCIILAEEINMEKPVTELKVRELIKILGQHVGGTWTLNELDTYTVVTGLSSPHRYRICNDMESEGYITIDIDGTHHSNKSDQINSGDCRDYEARQYLKIKRESWKTVKGTYRNLD